MKEEGRGRRAEFRNLKPETGVRALRQKRLRRASGGLRRRGVFQTVSIPSVRERLRAGTAQGDWSWPSVVRVMRVPLANLRPA